MIHSREDQPDAETEHFTKVNILRPFFSIIVEQIDKIDSQLQKSIKIDNHKKSSDQFLSISNINRLISIDYDRLPSIFIEYRKYRLDTSWIMLMIGGHLLDLNRISKNGRDRIKLYHAYLVLKLLITYYTLISISL